MQYLLSFLEGIITFISPCLLPMLPIYISYFAGQNTINGKNKALKNALGFVLGFTLLFVALGAFAGALGSFLKEYQTIVNIVSGIVVILFGLNFMGVIRLPFINNVMQAGNKSTNTGFWPSVMFGVIFSVSWTPCIGTFLGSALMLAAHTGETIQGIFMLLSFSLGLGIPFIVSAVLIERLKSTFDFIKRHYRAINIISGCMLVILGIVIATGMIGYLYALI